MSPLSRTLALTTLLLCVLPGLAQAQFLWSVSRRDLDLRQVDPATGLTIATPATLAFPPPGPLNPIPLIALGASAMAADPQTGTMYVAVLTNVSSTRYLATADTTTGTLTPIGDTGLRIASLAVSNDGTIYAVTGDGGSPAETLYTLNPSTGAATLIQTLGNGSDGEAISLADDGFLYHGSGLGALDEPIDGQIFERVTLPPGSGTTPIPKSGDPHTELTALAWNGTDFYAADRGGDLDDDPAFYRITKDGVTTAIGPLDHVSRGFAPVGSALACSIRRWRFDEPAGAAPAGTTTSEESICAEDGVVLGNGAQFTGTAIQLPGGVSGSGAGYVDLPNGAISSLTNVTFETWARVDGAFAWQRLFDFGVSGGLEVPPGPGGAGSDYVFLSAAIFTNTNAQRLEIAGAGGGFTTIDTAEPTPLGDLIHYVVTIEADAAGPGVQRLTLYRDAVRIAFDTTGNALSDVNDLNGWLGRSNYLSDGFLDGRIEEFRLYDTALDWTQVAFSNTQGPDVPFVVVPEPTATAMLLPGAIALAALSRRRRAGEPSSAEGPRGKSS